MCKTEGNNNADFFANGLCTLLRESALLRAALLFSGEKQILRTQRAFEMTC